MYVLLSVSIVLNTDVITCLRLLLTDVQVDDVVVHLGGLTIDLSVSFLLFFNRTRVFGIVLCSSFHLVNSQLFAIG